MGKTVQIVPHITDEIKRNIKLLGSKGEYDVVITEIGGTVGDIESLPLSRRYASCVGNWGEVGVDSLDAGAFPECFRRVED